MTRYSIKPRTRKYVKGMDFFHSQQTIQQMWEIIGYRYENRTRCCKKCLQKVVHKIALVIVDLIRNKIALKIVKPKSVPDENLRNVEKRVVPPEKKARNTKWFETNIEIWNTIKYLSC